ncbi:MAG: NADH:ubiquinone oxidoreductase [Anaerolineae bacterium]|jgi:coenzyme F420-reducing hydrogenase gamma subunit
MAQQKPKVGFFDFMCCEGCQLTVIDALQDHLDLLEAVEIVNFREASSERREDYQIAFIEGSITRPEDEERLRRIREQADVMVALGACAHIGCVNALKNLHAADDVEQWVYGDCAGMDHLKSYPVRPVSQVVEVDAFIPGCPIDREEFVEVVKALLLGKKPPIPDYPVCVECKLKGNVCVYELDRFCLGPITRAGCDARCPTYGAGCEGCRGLIPHPNENAMEEVLDEAGLTLDQIIDQFTLFNAHREQELEAVNE